MIWKGLLDTHNGRKRQGRSDVTPPSGQRSVSRGSSELTRSRVDDRSTDGEQENFHGHRDVQRLGELFRVLHVPDKRGDQSLSRKGVDDVEQRADSLNKGRAFRRPDRPGRRRLDLVDEAVRGILNSVSCKSERRRRQRCLYMRKAQQSRLTDDHEEEAQEHGPGTDGGGELGLAESSDQRPSVHEDADDQPPECRAESVPEGVDSDGSSVDVKTHDEDVVQGQTDESTGDGGRG